MNLTDEKCLVDLYNERRSIRDISKITGNNISTIYLVLKKYNVIRCKSDANKKFDLSLAIRLYNMGLSVRQISTLLDIDKSTILKRFKKENFITRPINVSKKIEYSNKEFKKFFLENNNFMKFIRELSWH